MLLTKGILLFDLTTEAFGPAVKAAIWTKGAIWTGSMNISTQLV